MLNQLPPFENPQQFENLFDMKRTYRLNPGSGFGDLFMIQPIFERTGDHLNLVLESGIGAYESIDLVNTLNPKINYFLTDEMRHIIDLFTDVRVLYEVHTRNRYGNKASTMSREAIERVRPARFEEKFIVVHPCTRGVERSYHRWSEVNLDGINHKVVGLLKDQTGLKKETLELRFPAVAALLRASRGVVCVDSSILNLANILGVPTIGIYPNKSSYGERRCSRPPLIDPSPDEVREACFSLLG